MKTELTHLLFCLAEECGELQQDIGKAGRFGVFDIRPHTSTSNWDTMRNELHDIVAIYEMLFTLLIEDTILYREMVEAKKIRVLKYMEYARDRQQLGLLEM